MKRLAALQIAPEYKEHLQTRLSDWLSSSGTSDLDKSVLLRIADASFRLDRLTDLLVDGTIDKASYELRKQNTEFELQRLREEERMRADRNKSEADLVELLDMASDLTGMFVALVPNERRVFLKNCIDQIVIRQGRVRLVPVAWLQEFNAMAADGDFTPARAMLNRSSDNYDLQP